jgi:4a-hydroxytetrahydrobiopterin dehydratase
MTDRLSAEELAAALETLPAWTGDEQGIRRTVEAADFLAGIRLVEAVARAAEAADHHPDIDIRWRRVTFSLVSHDAGGVTRRDVDLAARIDTLATDATA